MTLQEYVIYYIYMLYVKYVARTVQGYNLLFFELLRFIVLIWGLLTKNFKFLRTM